MIVAPSKMAVRTSRGELLLGGRTWIVGVLNVTPDSFSDGGECADAAAAVDRGMRMIAEGADVIDVGGESTRPGSAGVPADEQRRRVVPVIAGLRAAGAHVPISIDTRSAEVAAAALEAGAEIVNDVSALGHDPAMASLCARTGAAVVLMHAQGTPETMQAAPAYADVVTEVAAYLRARLDAAAGAGIARDRLIVDPGIGFGKTLEHNLSLLRGIDRLASLGVPLLVGPSRKAFLGAILHEPHPAGRDAGTAAVVTWCAAAGVHLVRVHNVRMMRQVVDVIGAIGE